MPRRCYKHELFTLRAIPRYRSEIRAVTGAVPRSTVRCAVPVVVGAGSFGNFQEEGIFQRSSPVFGCVRHSPECISLVLLKKKPRARRLGTAILNPPPGFEVPNRATMILPTLYLNSEFLLLGVVLVLFGVIFHFVTASQKPSTAPGKGGRSERVEQLSTLTLLRNAVVSRLDTVKYIHGVL